MNLSMNEAVIQCSPGPINARLLSINWKLGQWSMVNQKNDHCLLSAINGHLDQWSVQSSIWRSMQNQSAPFVQSVWNSINGIQYSMENKINGQYIPWMNVSFIEFNETYTVRSMAFNEEFLMHTLRSFNQKSVQWSIHTLLDQWTPQSMYGQSNSMRRLLPSINTRLIQSTAFNE